MICSIYIKNGSGSVAKLFGVKNSMYWQIIVCIGMTYRDIFGQSASFINKHIFSEKKTFFFRYLLPPFLFLLLLSASELSSCCQVCQDKTLMTILSENLFIPTTKAQGEICGFICGGGACQC